MAHSLKFIYINLDMQQYDIVKIIRVGDKSKVKNPFILLCVIFVGENRRLFFDTTLCKNKSIFHSNFLDNLVPLYTFNCLSFSTTHLHLLFN